MYYIFYNKKMINIIYEDEYFLIINKESGIEVDDSLIDIIKKDYPNIKELFLVHRLDKYTSGILILAKDNNTKTYFENAFKNREINKVYHAIVEGVPKNIKGTIDIQIAKDTKNPNKRIAVKKGGEIAITHYKVLKKFKLHSLLELKPITGRTHQIRVHLSYLGNPIIGDKIYSKNAKLYNIKSFALIAKEIHFIHP
ncbi:RluA family pseudouridine synthase, partial [uncultured Brachyspira sp.]